MIVTHIIGNGFDINQGLPTSYRSFYEYYLKQESSDSTINQLKQAISDNIEDWSDLELALGQYTDKVSSVDELDVVVGDLQEKLGDYISMIESQRHGLNMKAVESMEQDLVSPFRHLKPSEVERFNALINTIGGVSDVNVVSFNYTSTLEKILQLDSTKVIANKAMFRGTTYIHNPIIEKRNIVLGVDNPSQISKAAFRENPMAQLLLVKPVIIESAGNLNDRIALQKIDQANIISLFGVSLGATDTTWWKAIGKSINSHPNKRLIVYYYDLAENTNISRQLMAELDKKNQIVKLMGITDPNKVYVKQHDGTVMFKKAFTLEVK